MAGNAVIGALRVVIGADSAALEKGLKDAGSHLAGFGAGVAKAGAIASAAFVAAGAAIAVAVKGAINEADKLGKMAQSVGVPVEELSKLRLAAELSDVSIESLGKSLGKLSKVMVEAAAKPTSEAASAFKALGVSVTDSDGSLKSSSQVLSDVAGRFEALKDGAGKTAVSMALFGKSGAELIPLLNSGKDGLAAMKAEAEKLGIVIDSKTAKSAEEFNDNLTRLGKVKDGIILKITVGMLPALENLSANMVRVAKDSDGLKSAGEAVGAMMTGLFSIISHVSLGWNRLGVEFTALREFMKTDIFGGKVQENWQKFIATGEESTRQFEALRVTMETAHLADAFGDISVKTGAAAKNLKDFNYAAMAGKTALDGFLDSQQKSLASQQAEIATVGMAAGAKERLKLVLQGLAIAQTQSIPLTEALRMKLSETAFAAETLALKLQGAQLVQQNLAPGEAFRVEMENNRLAMEAFGASANQIAQVNQAVAERYGNTWGQVGQSVAGSFQNIGNAFAKESKSMAVVAKLAGVAQATISMFVGAAKALELPFPANIAAWATVLAQGASAVAGIQSVAVGGFAMGGAFRVPGGTGGGDRVPVGFMAEPGELVEISSNRAGGYQSGGGMGGTFVFQSVPDDHWVTGKQLRKFVEAYNDQAGELRLQMA